MKKQKDTVTSLTFKMFPLPNVYILTLMTSRCRGKKKNPIISRGALNRESLS